MRSCPGCGAPLSERASSCPNCGEDIQPRDRWVIVAVLAVAGMVVIALAGRLGYAVAGGLGLWTAAAFASLAVWSVVDRYLRR